MIGNSLSDLILNIGRRMANTNVGCDTNLANSDDFRNTHASFTFHSCRHREPQQRWGASRSSASVTLGIGALNADEGGSEWLKEERLTPESPRLIPDGGVLVLIAALAGSK